MKMIRSSAIIRRHSALFAQYDRMLTSSGIIRRHLAVFTQNDRMVTSSSIIRPIFAYFNENARKIRSSCDHLHQQAPDLGKKPTSSVFKSVLKPFQEALQATSRGYSSKDEQVLKTAEMPILALKWPFLPLQGDLSYLKSRSQDVFKSLFKSVEQPLQVDFKPSSSRLSSLFKWANRGLEQPCCHLHALYTRLFCRLHALLQPPYTPPFTPYSCPLFARPPYTPIGMNPARGRFCHD